MACGGWLVLELCSTMAMVFAMAAVMQILCCNSLNRTTKYDAKYRENNHTSKEGQQNENGDDNK